MNLKQIQSKQSNSRPSTIKAAIVSLILIAVFSIFPFSTQASSGFQSAANAFFETKLARAFLEHSSGQQFASKILGTPYSTSQYNLLISTLSKPEKSETLNTLIKKISNIEAQLIKKHGKNKFKSWVESTESWQWETREINNDLNALLVKNMKFSPRFYRPHLPKLDATETMYRMVEAGRGVSQKLLRYPISVNPELNPEAFIQFGFESEYTLNSIGKLLNSYMPEARFGISKEAWLAKTESQRVDFVKANLNDLFQTERQAGGLVKIPGDEAINFMPEALIKDSTGNIEIVLKPVDTLEEWQNNVKLIQERFGAGSMQGTLSMSHDAYFSSVHGLEASVKENLGMLNFFNEFDTLQKIQKGYERYLLNPSADTVKSFSHPFLGPITKMKQNLLKEYLNKNSKGEWLSPEELRRISGNDDSFKYIGGTAYRPDIAPGRIILEVRDAHNQLELLTDRLVRSLYFFQYGKSQFASAAPFHAFDSVIDFAKFPKKVQKMLKAAFPSKAYPNVDYTHNELLANEVFRNFAYPLKSWDNHIAAFSDATLASKVLKAQQTYLQTLKQISTRYESGAIKANQAGFEVQGALGKFVEESTLLHQFRKWTHSNLSTNPYYNRYINLITSELAPLSSAFPESIWEGTLQQRLHQFTQTHQNNVKMVPNVSFSYKAENGAYQVNNSRNVLIISTHGLTTGLVNSLTESYVSAFSRGTVSFPLSEAAGHLHTRIGTADFDFINSLSMNAYRPPSSTRLEAVIALKPTEELKLRFLTEQGHINPLKTLGEFGMNGATSGDVSRVLSRSRPNNKKEKHNCTSWIATSAVGQNGERLFELLGATPSMEIHTNPGWWSYFLTGAARQDRIPFVVYWTNKPLAEATSKIKSGEAFPEWDFYLH